LLSALASEVTGAVDAIGPSGHATTAELLSACVTATRAAAELVWLRETELVEAGAQPWTQLPCWVPEHGEFAGFFETDTTRAAATGLRCHPVGDTVTDTWTWLRTEGAPTQRADRDTHGLPTAIEQQLLHC